jgi:hypothetical protein
MVRFDMLAAETGLQSPLASKMKTSNVTYRLEASQPPAQSEMLLQPVERQKPHNSL